MSQVVPRNGLHGSECFNGFFENWLLEQGQFLEMLVSASKENDVQLENAANQRELDGRILSPLVERVIKHYEEYYNNKSRWATNDVFSMFNPSWLSSLEDAFLWIGGWRPSMAFHLLYSKSGIQLEAKLNELIQGISTGDLGDLSAEQLDRFSVLQEEIIREEKILTEKLAKKQETVADSAMVELSHIAAEVAREGAAEDEERIEATLAPKKDGLAEVLQKADDLRLKTLKLVLNILKPVQCVHFLIAAAELHLRFHSWGKKKDDDKNHKLEEAAPAPAPAPAQPDLGA